MTPMYRLPDDDAPMSEWTRPVSALLITRRTSFFSADQEAAAKSGEDGAMTQRVNKTRRKRPAKINMREFWHLRSRGVNVAEMATRLNVSTRSVERVMTMRRLDG